MSDALASDAVQQPAQAVQDTQGHKVFAGNLAYAITDDSLRSFFSSVADDIISAQVIMRGTRSAGYGFITVKTLEAAQKACDQLDKTELEGRQVIVEVAKPAEQKDKERSERRAKRRAGRARGRAPPGEVTEAEATGETDKTESAEAPPAVSSEGKRKNKKKKTWKKSKKTSAEGEQSVQPDGNEHVSGEPDDTAAEKKPAKKQREKRPSRPAGEDPAGEPSKTVLFVANLGFNVDDAGLTALFTDVGVNVVSARVVRRRWGKPRKSKGYGFVDVGDEVAQQKAISALAGKEVDGRQIAVKVAVNTQAEEAGENTSVANGIVPDASEDAAVVAN